MLGMVSGTMIAARHVPSSGKLKVWAPAVHTMRPVTGPGAVGLKVTLVEFEPVAGTVMLSGLAENTAGAGAEQDTTTGAGPGLLNVMVAVGAD